MYTLQTKSLRQDVCHLYVTCRMHAVLQRYFLTYPLFGRCLELPSLSLSTVVHLTRAEYHNNSHSQEKTRRCRFVNFSTGDTVYVTFVAIAHVYVTNKVIAPGRMPLIRYMQNARSFTTLFSNIPAFRQVLRVAQPIAFYCSTFN